MDPDVVEDSPPVWRETLANRLEAIGRGILVCVALAVTVVVPWFFGGMGPDGYFFIVFAGWAAAAPLALWLVARALRKRKPRAAFWIPVICWSLLGVQIYLSLRNSSHAPEAPWVGHGYTRIAHNEAMPSTAFRGATENAARLWLSIALIALAIRTLTLGPRQIRFILWALALNATLLAAIGVPFKFSGAMKVLGIWPAPEWYFYSTFLYHNHWCAYALLGVSAAAALFVSHPHIWVRCALLAAGCVIAGSAPISISRFGTLAMLGFAALVAWKAWRAHRRQRAAKSAPANKGPLIIAALVGVLLFGGSVAYFRGEQRKPGGHRNWSTLLQTNPFGVRVSLFEDTLPMVWEKPVFGWGLGAYGAAFRHFQRPESRVVHNNGRITLYEHPHNDWLEFLAELGVVGFGLLLAPAAYWIHRARKIGRLNGSRFWLMAGCTGVLIFAIGEIIFFNRAVAATFAVCFAVAVSPGLAQAKTRENPT